MDKILKKTTTKFQQSLLHSGKKYQENNFPSKFTSIVYLANDTIEWDTGNNIIFRLYNDTSLLNNSSNTYRINYWMELMEDKYQYLFYQCKKIIVPNYEFKKLFPNDLFKIISCYQKTNTLPKNIKQYIISDKINHVEEQFKLYLNLSDFNYNKLEPCYFFGLYNEIDFQKLISHKGDKHLIFGGSDLDNNMYHTKILIPNLKKFMLHNKVNIYYISDNLFERGLKLGLDGSLIYLDLIKNNWDLLRPTNLNEIKNRRNIYCYCGYNKIGKLYNYDLLKQIEIKLPEYNFIYSHTLNKSFKEMPEIYQKCALGIRLTKKDGNANTVIEMGKLGIPIIFNGNNYNAINYEFDNIDDIIIKIKSFLEY